MRRNFLTSWFNHRIGRSDCTQSTVSPYFGILFHFQWSHHCSGIRRNQSRSYTLHIDDSRVMMSCTRLCLNMCRPSKQTKTKQCFCDRPKALTTVIVKWNDTLLYFHLMSRPTMWMIPFQLLYNYSQSLNIVLYGIFVCWSISNVSSLAVCS